MPVFLIILLSTIQQDKNQILNPTLHNLLKDREADRNNKLKGNLRSLLFHRANLKDQ